MAEFSVLVKLPPGKLPLGWFPPKNSHLENSHLEEFPPRITCTWTIRIRKIPTEYNYHPENYHLDNSNPENSV